MIQQGGKFILRSLPWPRCPEGLKTPGWKRIFWALQLLCPEEPVSRPVFLVGCGRSGTTILGRIIGQHRNVLYLHEPRFIWAKAFPFTDVWSRKAPRRRGRLDLDGTHVSEGGRKAVARMLQMALWIYGRSRLVEKQPENVFRIPFIRSCFPDARFIHVVRNGLEVAWSIAREQEAGAWYGPMEYKWRELVRLARDFSWGNEAVSRCRENVHKGLLEWRLSMEYAQRGLKGIPSSRVMTLSYERLLEEPLAACRMILEFIGEGPDPSMERYAAERVSRRSAALSWSGADEDQRWIAGDWPAKLGYA